MTSSLIKCIEENIEEIKKLLWWPLRIIIFYYLMAELNKVQVPWQKCHERVLNTVWSVHTVLKGSYWHLPQWKLFQSLGTWTQSEWRELQEVNILLRRFLRVSAYDCWIQGHVQLTLEKRWRQGSGSFDKFSYRGLNSHNGFAPEICLGRSTHLAYRTMKLSSLCSGTAEDI